MLAISLTDYNCFGVHLLSRHHESLAGVAYSWRCQLCWRERALDQAAIALIELVSTGVRDEW